MKKTEDSWNENYKIAKNYYEKHGNLNINTNYKTKEEKQLGIWLSNQRSAYKSKLKIGNLNKKPLTDTQVELLENIGMIWDKGLYNYSNKKINRERKRLIEIRAYKFLKKYAAQIKNEIETYEDIKNINEKFSETLGQSGKTKIK